MKNKHTGNCCLCGKFRELSFEHFPPKCAHNSNGTFEAFDFMDYIQEKGTWKNKKKVRGGLGAYTLCRSCNSHGGRYAREYKDWVDYVLENFKTYDSQTWHGIFKDVYPIRFLKSVVAMFCSLNGPKFAEKYTDMKDFVMSKDSVKLPPNITVFMYLNTSKLISRMGITGLIEFGPPSKIYVVSEYNFPPFGFAMYTGLTKYESLTDITWFDGYDYDEKVDLPLTLPILERNVPFPADYRTESEILHDKIIDQAGGLKSQNNCANQVKFIPIVKNAINDFNRTFQ